MPKPLLTKELIDKALIAIGLVSLSALLYFIHYFAFDGHHDAGYYGDKIFSHIAFLPIHALVLGIIIEGMISFKENISRRKRLNMFLGIFFRQLGAEFLALASDMCKNRDALDGVTLIHEQWKSRDFRKARANLREFKVEMEPDEAKLLAVLDMLKQRENDILTMTRNPLVLDFEYLHDGLVSLLHLIEEIHYRDSTAKFAKGEIKHLAKDVGKALVRMTNLWLTYMEYLKAEHPVLFTCQVGVCSTIGPTLMEDRLDD